MEKRGWRMSEEGEGFAMQAWRSLNPARRGEEKNDAPATLLADGEAKKDWFKRERE